MLRKLALAVAASGSLLAAPAFGLGIGEIKLDSALNQPMNAKISLLQADDLSENEIVVTLASTQEFARAGIARPFYLQDFEFDVIVDGDNFYVNIKSAKPVREPFVSFLMEINWPSGRSVKEFTVFLDPPVFDKANNSSAPINQAVVRATNNAPSTLTTNTTVSLGAPSVNQTANQSAQRSVPRAIPKFIPKNENLSDDEYRVQMDDTLWKVAQRVKHSGISTNSMMHALHQNNPSAFIRGDINRVKAGSILTVPSSSEVNSGQFSGATVTSEIKPQILSNAVPSQVQTTVSDDEKVDGHLTLTLDSQGDESGDGAKSNDDKTQDELLKSEDLNDQLVRENEQLNARIEALELQLKYVDRLVGVQDETATTLQQLAQQEEKDKLEKEALENAEAISSANAAMDTELNTIDPMGSDDSVINEAADSDDLASDARVVGDESTEMSAEQAMVSSSADIENVEIKDASSNDSMANDDANAESEPVVETDVKAEVDTDVVDVEEPVANDMVSQTLAFVENQIEKMKENTVYAAIIVASGVFILLLPFLLLALFRRKDEEEEVLIIDDMPEALVDNETLDQLDDEEVESLEEADVQTATSSVEEALSNAELYIAYGHYDQAAAAIQEIIASNPENADLKLKLAEIFAESGDTHKLEAVSSELKALNDTGVNRKLDTILANAQVGESNDFEDEIDLTKEFGEQGITPTESKEDDNVQSEAEEFDLDFATDVDLTGSNAIDDEEISLELESELDSNELDFDLNFDAPEDSEDAVELELDNSENTLDFSLDDEVESNSGESDIDLPVVTSDENSLDFDLDLSSEFTLTDSEEEIDHSENTIDLDLSLSSDDKSEPEETFDFDLDGGVSLEFDLDMGDADETIDSPVASESLDLELDSEEFDLDMGVADKVIDSADEPENLDLELDSAQTLDSEDFDFDLGDMSENSEDDADAELNIEAFDFDEDSQTDELASLSTALDNLADETRGAEDTLDADLASLTEDAESLDFLSGGDEVGTKLDLARAYIDMDDTDGAREILEEIVTEGDDEQKSQAKALLGEL
jgi:pilus assembly protein FimV